MRNIKLEQIGGKVKATIEAEHRSIPFQDMASAIMHCNAHGFTITNAADLPLFFQNLIKK